MIRWEASTHPVNVSPGNVIANQASQGMCGCLIKGKIAKNLFSRLHCDQCEPYKYGFSSTGCKPCDCDNSGSKGFQCDQDGQCPCNDNVEGRRCDRCKENKYDRHQGCLDCPHCYNLVQEAADEHRQKLSDIKKTLKEIQLKPTVIDDDEFEFKLRTVQEKIAILTDDAKSGAGGGDRSLVERLNDLHDRLKTVGDLLDNSESVEETITNEVNQATEHVAITEDTNVAARNELSVSKEKCKIM